MAKQQTKPWHDEPAHRVQDLVSDFAQTEEGAPERLRAELGELLAKISEELKIS